ncbi:MAG: flagellum-specific ATP synthase FliI, partial [Pseudorhodobacter sp.]|nr:flagellum-specific ATP synthase FliI [Pseudorhodobacter sp.]
MIGVFDSLQAELARIVTSFRVGRIAEIGRGTLLVTGLAQAAALGDRVLIRGKGAVVGGEVLALAPGGLTVLPEGSADGLAIGDAVELTGRAEIAPDDSWIGRIVDAFGKPLDGRALPQGAKSRSLCAVAPLAASRRRLGARLSTSVAVFDTLLPLVRGQRLGLFAGSGVGKSSLLAKFARGVAADVVVIALVGERGRELREFTDGVLGPQGMARSVVVTATSDQS